MTALFLLLLILLVLVNGFFVAAEFALVRTRRSRIEALESEGTRGAALTLRQLDRIDEYLAACQLGITMASIGIGFLGEPALAELFEPLLGDLLGHGAAVAVAFGLAFAISTAAHITVGEQVPKIYAITFPERISRRASGPLHLFFVSLKPLISVLNAASNGMLRLVGVNTTAATEEGETSEDLKLVIAQSVVGGKLDPGEAVMLSGVFHLHEQQARQVMTPIPAVVTVDFSESVEAALRRCIESGHTRLVVIENDDDDKVLGTVHNNSLARRLLADGPEASLDGLVRDVPIVPETKPLDDLLADLQRDRKPIALVVDEYGRTAGIVSIEDIVEEVVGEISDDTDPVRGTVRQLQNGDWYVRGHVPITDLMDYGLNLPVDSDAYNSVGGYVFAELGRLPKRGDMVRANGYSLRVESVRENRVDAVRIRDHEPGRRRRGDSRAALLEPDAADQAEAREDRLEDEPGDAG